MLHPDDGFYKLPRPRPPLGVGTLWHGGGPNRADRARLAVPAQYCEPWLRQQENFMLEVPPGTARALSPTLQTLIGYSINPPFMGMVDSKHPKRVLGDI